MRLGVNGTYRPAVPRTIAESQVHRQREEMYNGQKGRFLTRTTENRPGKVDLCNNGRNRTHTE